MQSHTLTSEKAEQRLILSRLINTEIIHMTSDLVKVAEKNGGAHDAGDKGGVYQSSSDPKRKFLFKQDSDYIKNIIEYVAGKMMALLNPLHPEIVGKVELAFIDDSNEIDCTGKRVYIASEWYDNFTSLHQDAYDAYNFLEPYQSTKKSNHTIPRPSSRPVYYHQRDAIINNMILLNRYTHIHDLFVSSLIIDDPDVHTDNLGSVPIPRNSVTGNPNGIEKEKIGEEFEVSSPYIFIRNKGKLEKLFLNVMAVRIDYGGALGGHQQFDGNLHLYDASRYHSITKKGPPNYFLTYSEKIFTSKEFVEALIKKSCMPLDYLHSGIHDIIENVANYYGKDLLLAFSKKIGVLDHFKDLNIDNEIDTVDLISYISTFLRRMINSRLIASEDLAKNIANKLGISEQDIEYMKANAQFNYIKLFNRANETENKQEYDLNDDRLQHCIAHIRSTLEDILSIEIEEDETNKLFLIQRAHEIYTNQTIMTFLKFHDLHHSIEDAINKKPSLMMRLVSSVCTAIDLFEHSHIHSPLYLFNDTHLNTSGISFESMNIAIDHILDQAAVGLNEYIRQVSASHSFTLLFANKEKEFAQLVYSFLRKEETSIDKKIFLLICLLSYNSNTPKLRECLAGKMRSVTGKNTLQLSHALTTLLTKKFHYEAFNLQTHIAYQVRTQKLSIEIEKKLIKKTNHSI